MTVKAFVQISFLYLQLLIPFVAAFWLIFGGEHGDSEINALSAEELARLGTVKNDTKSFTDLDQIVRPFYLLLFQLFPIIFWQ